MIIIVGGGISGLAAGIELAQSGRQVLLLEGRNRLGGRLLTVFDNEFPDEFPVELGAEFVHGKALELHDQLNEPQAFCRTAEEHDVYYRGKICRSDFDQRLEPVFEGLSLINEDLPMTSYFDKIKEGLPALDFLLFKSYIEGLFCADSETLSALSMADMGGDDYSENSRLTIGYSALISRMEKRFKDAGGKVALETTVNEIKWKRDSVSLSTNVGPLEAEKALITVPLSCLQTNGDAKTRLSFSPPLREKAGALELLEIGKVVKPFLRFRAPLWDTGNTRLHFLHSPELDFTTRWVWKDAEGFLVTSWAGGSGTRNVAHLSVDEVLSRALENMSLVSGIPRADLNRDLMSSHYHDWNIDPYTQGGYSFTRVGGLVEPGARSVLAQPVADTLFFAGEATATDGRDGTVHGALATGLRAAGELKAALARTAMR